MKAESEARPARRLVAARLGRTLFWELLQNLPLVVGLIFGLALWRQDWHLAAAGCITAGGATGALLIRYTESRITGGKREAWGVTAANLGGMSTLMLALTVYLAAPGQLVVDALVGAGMGLLVGAVQSLAAHERFDARHTLALTVACAFGLVSLRLVVAAVSVGASIAIITSAVTLIIAAVDYAPEIIHPMGSG